MRRRSLAMILATAVISATASGETAKPAQPPDAEKAKPAPATVAQKPSLPPAGQHQKPTPQPGATGAKPAPATDAANVLGTRRVPTPPPPPTAAPPARQRTIEKDVLSGRYLTNGRPDNVVTVSPLGGSLYRVMQAEEWEGTGIFDGAIYWGVFRYGDRPRDGRLAGVSGTHRGVLENGTLRVSVEFLHGYAGRLDHTWEREKKITVVDPGTSGLPALGDYVYVEELPEAITKVAPEYPDAARNAGIDGTVLVQVLVGRDGRVLDTRIVKSIPELDAAADAATRQWIFKPALAKGQPVAVWVAVPVRFSAH